MVEPYEWGMIDLVYNANGDVASLPWREIEWLVSEGYIEPTEGGGYQLTKTGNERLDIILELAAAYDDD